uniref:Carbohydrate kinase FGGY C-terminal domain-containing protein n=1 Tax=Manihot esculenta TaxID=3983 RepID=A0A199UA92_MANES
MGYQWESSVLPMGVISAVAMKFGKFAPWWRDDARGVCIGITRFTNKSHIAGAVLESMCFQVKDVLDSMHKDAGEKGENRNAKGEFLLRVDGGATVNNLLIQLQLFAFIIQAKTDTIFRPLIDEELRKKRADSWFKAVERTFSLADLSI